MRFLRLLPLAAVFLTGACDEDGSVTNAVRPPLAYIRYVHAVADADTLDFKFMDGVEYSPSFAGYRFRDVGYYQGARAGARAIKVFRHSRNITNTQVALIDETINLTAGTYYTLLHVGYQDSTGVNADRLVIIDDTRPAQDAGTHISAVNAAQGLANQDFHITATSTSTLVGSTPFATNIASGARTAYTARAALTAFGVQGAATGGTVSTAGAASFAGAAGTAAADPIGGHNVAGTQFSAFLFPRSRAGSPALSFTTPGITLVVDRQPPRTVPD